jgi:predicted site-specific integrase-resolvase
MQKTYSTAQAARRMGVSFRTLNRWIALGLIRSSQQLPYVAGRILWRWNEADITKGRKVKAAHKPGPKVSER